MLTEFSAENWLEQNYPNPFNPSTANTFTLRENSRASIIPYNVIGKEITTSVEKKLPAGYDKIQWQPGIRLPNLSVTGKPSK